MNEKRGSIVPHLLGIKQLQKEEIEHLLTRAQYFAEHPQESFQSLRHHFIANLFFENSTRTRFSFEVAEKRLGAHVLNFQSDTSSIQKGESVYDTVKTLESMGVQAAVIRHSQNGILEELKDKVALQLVNAGTGNEEHPTQALLDFLTIQQEFGSFNNLKVAIIGDIEHSRVARSNLIGLQKLGADVLFAGPDSFKPRQETLFSQVPWVCVDEAVQTADVVMMLRVQHERHKDGKRLELTADQYLQAYGLTEARASQMRKQAIIMHPLPVNRGVEMETTVIEAPQSRVFKQVANGVSIRMAVLEYVLNKSRQSIKIDSEPNEQTNTLYA